jgi:uncharacterized protein
MSNPEAWAEGLAARLPGQGSSLKEAFGVRASLWRTPRTRALLLLGTVGLTIEAIKLLAGIYVNLLWFNELGQRSVYWTTLKWKIIAGGVTGFGTAFFLLLNFAVVERVMVKRARTTELPRPIAELWRFRQLVYPAVAVSCGLAISRSRSGPGWQQLILWTHRSPFGTQDPIFHRDIGFFVFSLPLYQQVSEWLLEMLFLAGLCTVGAYVIAGGLRFARPLSMGSAIRAHLLVLGALFLFVVAWRLRLEQFGLVLPHDHAPVPGASFTDVRVRLPALRILMGMALVASGLCLYATVRRFPFRPLMAAAAIGAVAIAGASFAPSVIERYAVQPQALSRERPYVVDAITSTRRAFGLDRIRVRPFSDNRGLTDTELAANRSTVENVPLWDDNVLRASMNELESLGSYYRFGRPTVDRYTIGGVPHVMTIAARQLDLSRVALSAKGWANKRFAYTHGYGVVAVGAAGTDAQQFPSFAQREFDSPDNPLRLYQPRIYFGARPNADPAYLVVPSKRGEVEQPTAGTQTPTYHYDGSGGISLSSPLRRAAFAAHFGDLRLLLSGTITNRSRIILRRDVHQRLQTLAPFLHWDARPQTTVIGGRVTYLFHGYTTSPDYPYSARIGLGSGQVNYIREAARAAVDAFDGRVLIFAAEPADPIMRAWQAAYPTLFRPAWEMPSAMRAHLRYPTELFKAQLAVYVTYHASDPDAFWTGDDTWTQPLQLAGPVEAAGEIHFPDPQRLVDPDERRAAVQAWQMRPQYLLARLPGQATEHFMLVMPFTPRGRHNLVSYLAAWVGDDGRLQLTLLSLPRNRLTVGPAQASRRIISTPAVNARLQLLNRESRDLGNAAVLRTILGAPRIVPVGNQLVEVQPAYVSAGGDGIPKLQLVTVYANGRVGYGRSLETALRLVVRGNT